MSVLLLELNNIVYCIILDELARFVTETYAGRPEDQHRFLSALTRAIFLDLGLSISVYYESKTDELEAATRDLALSLARAGEFRDTDTGMHVLRMSKMCEALARALGQNGEWIHMIGLASPLHDIGKIGIPDAILRKPGQLDAGELVVMREHPVIAGEIIPANRAAIVAMARRIALTHHERWDGTGYPVGLRGEEIPLEGRIAAICDVYDALHSPRPYKESWSRERTLEHLQSDSGAHFDPRLVQAFLSIQLEIDAIQTNFSGP